MAWIRQDDALQMIFRYFQIALDEDFEAPSATPMQEIIGKWPGYEVFSFDYGIYGVPLMDNPFYGCNDLQIVIARGSTYEMSGYLLSRLAFPKLICDSD